MGWGHMPPGLKLQLKPLSDRAQDDDGFHSDLVAEVISWPRSGAKRRFPAKRPKLVAMSPPTTKAVKRLPEEGMGTRMICLQIAANAARGWLRLAEVGFAPELVL